MRHIYEGLHGLHSPFLGLGNRACSLYAVILVDEDEKKGNHISIPHLVIVPKIGQDFVKCKPHKHSNLLESTSYLEIIFLFPTFNILWIIDDVIFVLNKRIL